MVTTPVDGDGHVAPATGGSRRQIERPGAAALHRLGRRADYGDFRGARRFAFAPRAGAVNRVKFTGGQRAVVHLHFVKIAQPRLVAAQRRGRHPEGVRVIQVARRRGKRGGRRGVHVELALRVWCCFDSR